MEQNYNNEEQLTGLTQKLMDVEKKQYSMLRIMMVANVVLAACLVLAMLLVVPKLLSVANDAQDAIADVHTLAGSAQESLNSIDEVVENANKTVTSAGTVLEENAEGMEEALSNINGIDFEALNDAIRDLAKAVEPLANLSQILS